MRFLTVGLAAATLALVAAVATAAEPERLLPGTNVKDALQDGDGALWAACGPSGLAVRRNGAWEVTTSLETPIPSTSVLRLCRTGDTLWASFLGEGLRRRREGRWAGPESPPLAPGPVGDMVTWRGALWCALGDELARVGEDGATTKVRPPLTPDTGALVTCLAVAPDDTLVAGTNQSIVLVHDGMSWATLDLRGRIRGRFVRAVAVVDDTVWVGTFGGLYALHGAELRQVDLPGTPAAPLVTTLVSEGRALWVGTWGMGLLRLDGATWSSWPALPRFVNALRATGNGVLACTTEGLVTVGTPVIPRPAGGGSPGSPDTPH